MYHSAETVGAFASVGLILRLGNNYSFVVSPPLLSIAGAIWFFIAFSVEDDKVFVVDGETNYFRVRPSESITKFEGPPFRSEIFDEIDLLGGAEDA